MTRGLRLWWHDLRIQILEAHKESNEIELK